MRIWNQSYQLGWWWLDDEEDDDDDDDEEEEDYDDLQPLEVYDLAV